jgi:iron complex transport system ATP-binding protein
MNMNVLLAAQQLHFHTHDDVTLVRGVSLQVRTGEVVGLIGPNGAGKSSLLKLLAGLRPPTQGTVSLLGSDLSQLAPLPRARAIGYLEQRPVLHWPFSVYELVALARLPYADAAQPSGQQAVAKALAAVQIQSLASRQVASLSEGEKLLVNLARVLAGTPTVVLADEPTAALDPAHQHHVMTLLRAQAKQGLGLLVVMHDLTLAARYCDRLILLQHGAVIADGLPTAVLTPEKLRTVYQLDARFDHTTATLITAVTSSS